MSVTITTEAAVTATCSRCGQTSRPMKKEEVESFRKVHEELHDKQDRRKRWADQGHATNGHVNWVDCDDSSGYAYCSCGWKSKNVKTCWINDMIDEHLREVEAEADAE